MKTEATERDLITEVETLLASAPHGNTLLTLQSNGDITAPDGLVVLKVWNGYDNGRLAVAAPELLRRLVEEVKRIRDWRAMKAENEPAEKVLKFILPNRPLATITEIAKPALDEVDALREQLAAMKIERDNFERMALALSAQLESELRG